MKNLVFTKDDLNWDYRKFDFDKDLGQLDNFRVYVDATQADLSEFRSRGGKLLMYYGWADQLLPPMMGVNYYERALQANGPDTKEFFRFFTAPGMFHCQGGVGPDRFDAVTAVVNWVENGVAPASLKATQMEAGKVKRTRPLCPYPDVARYSGKGDVNDAANFSCRAPL
jgi:feruloyl esterase